MEIYLQYLLYIFYVIVGIQLFFIVIIFGKMLFIKQKKQTNQHSTYNEAVSVIICAKNEYLKLKKLLPFVLEQNYKNYEVIVVNDSSTDDTEFLLKEFQQKYSHLKYINVQSGINFFRGKKFPLSIGIKSAKNDLLILTDADCRPASENWIQEIQSKYTENTEIVLGYGAYETHKGFLNKLIRYETIRVAITYLSFANFGIPYMGVGRNLSYRKKLFYKQKGFLSHYTIPSGDDDLFINTAANRKNTQIALGKDSKTISIPEKTFGKWINQKRRHYTTGYKYKKWNLLLLGLWEISSLLFFVVFTALVIFQINIVIISILFASKIICHLIVNNKFMKINDEKKLLAISPLLELFIVILEPLIIISNIFKKQRKWK